MAAGETAGKWSRSVEVKPLVTSTMVELNGVSCTSGGNCVAVGDYEQTTSSGEEPMAAAESSGKWARAVELRFPNNAASGNCRFGFLYQARCVSKGNCTAAGFYADSSNNRQPMVITEAAGKWGRATEFDDLPSNASGS